MQCCADRPGGDLTVLLQGVVRPRDVVLLGQPVGIERLAGVACVRDRYAGVDSA